MIINSVRIKNFMAFYGEQHFNISAEKEKNVTVIFASNDVGKSCFFKAIEFVLFGVPSSQISYINGVALRESGFDGIYVSLQGKDGKDEIEITRSFIPKTSKPEKSADLQEDLSVTINGDTDALKNRKLTEKEYLRTLIDPAISMYFLFDGEKLDPAKFARGPENKKAIMRTLGLTEIEYARDDLKKVTKDIDSDLTELQKKDNKSKEIAERKAEIKKEVDVCESQVEMIKQEIEEVETRLTKLNEELEKHEEYGKLMEKTLNAKERWEESKSHCRNLKNNLMEFLRAYASLVISAKTYTKLQQQVSTSHDILAGRQVEKLMTISEFIEDLRKEALCVCGTELNSDKLRSLDTRLEKIREKMGTGTSFAELKIAVFRKMRNEPIEKGGEYFGTYLAKIEEIREKEREVREREDEKLELQKQLDSFSVTDLEARRHQLIVFEEKREELKDRKSKYEGRIEKMNEDLRKLSAQLSSLNVSKECMEFENQLRIAKEAESVFRQFLDKLTEKKREMVENDSSSVFRELTNRPDRYKGLKVDEDYKLMVQMASDDLYHFDASNPISPSTGQSKIIAMSFLAGINRVAKGKVPVVIDNPVGLFSEDHRVNVINYLPKFSEQVIVMATEEDLRDKYQKQLAPFVDFIYYLEDTNKNPANIDFSKTMIKEKARSFD